MKRLLLVAAIFAGLSASAFAQSLPPLSVQEVDGSPRATNVSVIKVSNGTLSCASNRVCTITIGGGGGTTINATNGVLPYRSDATTFLDSPLSVSSGRLISTASTTTSGVLPYARIIATADTGQTADTEFPGIVFGGNASGATVTRTGADGTTLTTQREFVFTNPTYAFAGATTVTNAATVAIAAAPVASTNATITNPYAFWVQSGNSLFAGTISSPGAGTSSERFGSGATAAGNSSVVVGNGSSGPGTGNTIIGAGLTPSSNTYHTLVGQGITSGTLSDTLIGAQTNGGSGGFNVAVGYQATTANGGVAIGAQSTNAANTFSIALGYTSTNTAANQFVAGGDAGSTAQITSVFFGEGVTNATPLAYTINGTGGSGTNTAGAALNLAGGRSTGTAAGGELSLQVSPAGAGGTTANTLVTVGQFDAATTAGATRFLLWDIDAGALKRVTIGAADSCTAGFKCLRVAN